MNFSFVCPNHDKVFECDVEDFNIIEKNGVTLDEDGNKSFDAFVVLKKPCPCCGEKHEYHAGELSCPFGE